ncbi:hypothetical protein [Streptomyces sp. NRRL F-2580]|uniref:hypothetical protein n=1 Tax=Streptomyces sp. NRRL F-2580 TaxID=1463841 RepID=UPI000A49A869|nr:hypothetical protein [Streptomyces sp. NRRL F-2580]
MDRLPNPAADTRLARAPKAFGGLAALAYVACCALPVLIAAGVVGAGAGAVGGLADSSRRRPDRLSAGTWWFGRRRHPFSCAPKTAGEGGCGCKASAAPPKISIAGRK